MRKQNSPVLNYKHKPKCTWNGKLEIGHISTQHLFSWGMFANPNFWAFACQKTVITECRALRRESGLGFLSINSPFRLRILDKLIVSHFYTAC